MIRARCSLAAQPLLGCSAGRPTAPPLLPLLNAKAHLDDQPAAAAAPELAGHWQDKMGRWNLKSKLKRHFNGSTDANDVAGSPEKKDATSATITVQEIAVRSESRNGSKTSSLVSPAPNKTPATGEAERSLVLSTSDSTSILGLWDLAYEKLREEDESSVEEYEEKLSRDLGTGLGSTLDTRSLGRQELMDMVLQRKMDVINSEAWKLRFGSTEVQVKDLVQPVLGIISRVNGYVSDALAPNPSASMAWAGVSLLLPVCATVTSPVMFYLTRSNLSC